jgi:hypothetical protein
MRGTRRAEITGEEATTGLRLFKLSVAPSFRPPFLFHLGCQASIRFVGEPACPIS